jgi:hypothetical protein
MNNQRISRLERYFRDPIVGEGYLHKGARNSEACRNIGIALGFLGYTVAPKDEYDEELGNAVTAFQDKSGHQFIDGIFGPGTRKRLVEEVLKKGGERLFLTMKHPEGNEPPSVFLSYAWDDTHIINKIDQWLRDNGVRVSRDTRDFMPGMQLDHAIVRAIAEADKVIVAYSSYSKNRDWPQFERVTAEQEERLARKHFLIYLVLDDTALPKHDPNRIAVLAKGKPLRDVGADLLRGIMGQKTEPKRYEYDENEIL